MTKRFLPILFLVTGFVFLTLRSASAVVRPEIPETGAAQPVVPGRLIIKYKKGLSFEKISNQVQQDAQGKRNLWGFIRITLGETLTKLQGEPLPAERLARFQELKSRLGVSSEHRLFTPSVAPGGKEGELQNYFVLSFSPTQTIQQALFEYQNLPEVVMAEPDYLYYVQKQPNDPLYPQMWAWPKISAPTAWETTTGSTAITAAIIDTGIDSNHEDLADGRVIKGRNYVGCGLPADDPADQYGHGTHVAGTVGAVTNNSLGVAAVNWDIKILAYKIGCGDGAVSSSAGATAIKAAADQGAKVINLSWGGFGSSGLLNDATQYAYDQGTVVVAAAGNKNAELASFAPANANRVIAVTATDSADAKALFSNYSGTGLHPRNGLVIAAPGVSILSLGAAGNPLCGGQKYCVASGTSMAAPHLAGAVALLFAVNSNLTVDQVHQILKETADPLSDSRLGVGRLNLAAAVAAASGGETPSPSPEISPTVSPTPTPTAGVTPRPTISPSPGVSPSPTPAPSPTAPPVTLSPTPSPPPTPTLGDLNGDGKIDKADLEILKQNYSPFVKVPGNLADLDGDGFVNALDYSILKANIAASPTPSPTLIGPTSPPTPTPPIVLPPIEQKYLCLAGSCFAAPDYVCEQIPKSGRLQCYDSLEACQVACSQDQR